MFRQNYKISLSQSALTLPYNSNFIIDAFIILYSEEKCTQHRNSATVKQTTKTSIINFSTIVWLCFPAWIRLLRQHFSSSANWRLSPALDKKSFGKNGHRYGSFKVDEIRRKFNFFQPEKVWLRLKIHFWKMWSDVAITQASHTFIVLFKWYSSCG